MDLSKFNPNMRMYEGNHLGIARAHMEPRVATLMPDAFILFDTLPSWENATVKNYTTREMLADFMECKLYIGPGGGTREPIENGCQNFMFVINGGVTLKFDGQTHKLGAEGYFWLPQGTAFSIRNEGDADAHVLWVKKVYEPTGRYLVPAPIVSSVNALPEIISKTEPAEVKQECLPSADMGFDMAMNMLTYHPGVSFPRVEIHCNVHGCYFLNGRGGMWLNGVHNEVHEGDYCYMAPFVPH